MADESDVETALAALADAALYPNGDSSPCALGVPARIFRGWPDAAGQAAAMKAGKVLVSIMPRQGMARSTTRYLDGESEIDNGPATLTASVSGSTATFGGTPGPGQIAGVIVGHVAYATRTGAGDSLAAVASRIAALIPGAVASGATVTMMGLTAARTARDGGVSTELARWQQVFTLTIWAPTPDLRDAAARVLGAALAAPSFLSLADGTAGRIIPMPGGTSDASQEASVYRRELLAQVEYAVTSRQDAARVLFPLLSTALAGGAPSPAQVAA